MRLILKLLLKILDRKKTKKNRVTTPSERRKMDFLRWNTLNQAQEPCLSIEWNYHMFSHPVITGSFGLCLINPERRTGIPSGVILIAYGVFHNENQSFKLFRMQSTRNVSPKKQWPTESYSDDKTCRVKIIENQWSIDLTFYTNKRCNEIHTISDTYMGIKKQYWQVTYPWLISDSHVKGEVTVSTGDDKNKNYLINARSYFENSAGKTLFINLSWFFFSHMSDDIQFVFQSYRGSDALMDLVIHTTNRSIRFNHTEIKIKIHTEKIHPLKHYRQYVPYTFSLNASNQHFEFTAHFSIQHHVEAKKHNPNQNPRYLFKHFFILFIAGNFTGSLKAVNDNTIKPYIFNQDTFSGEYAKHNLFLQHTSENF